jgi:hypothetical protein
MPTSHEIILPAALDFQLKEGITGMPTITTKDGTEIFYKDWGSGQPITFSHGWPLSFIMSDDFRTGETTAARLQRRDHPRCEGMMERAHTGTVGPPFLLALVNGGSDGARPNP